MDVAPSSDSALFREAFDAIDSRASLWGPVSAIESNCLRLSGLCDGAIATSGTQIWQTCVLFGDWTETLLIDGCRGEEEETAY